MSPCGDDYPMEVRISTKGGGGEFIDYSLISRYGHRLLRVAGMDRAPTPPKSQQPASRKGGSDSQRNQAVEHFREVRRRERLPEPVECNVEDFLERIRARPAPPRPRRAKGWPRPNRCGDGRRPGPSTRTVRRPRFRGWSRPPRPRPGGAVLRSSDSSSRWFDASAPDGGRVYRLVAEGRTAAVRRVRFIRALAWRPGLRPWRGPAWHPFRRRGRRR